MSKITKQQIVENNIIAILNENDGEMSHHKLRNKSAIPPIDRAITLSRFTRALNNLNDKIYTHRDVNNGQTRHKIVKLKIIEAIL